MKAIYEGKTYEVVCRCTCTDKFEGRPLQRCIDTREFPSTDNPVFVEGDKGSDDRCPWCGYFMWINTNNPLD